MLWLDQERCTEEEDKTDGEKSDECYFRSI